MSNEAMTRVWKYSTQHGNALLVLLAIADMADDFMVCYPGKGHLANKCRLGKRAINAIITKLVESGELQVYHRRAGNVNSSNVYRVCIEDRVMNRDSSIGNRVMNRDSSGGESGFSRGGESGFSRVGNQDSPITLNKPKKESIGKQKPLTPFDQAIKDEEL